MKLNDKPVHIWKSKCCEVPIDIMTDKVCPQCKQKYVITTELNTYDLTEREMEILERLSDYIVSGRHGTYRWLIYDVLDGIQYCSGMSAGLFRLNNWLYDNSVYIERLKRIIRKLRKRISSSGSRAQV